LQQQPRAQRSTRIDPLLAIIAGLVLGGASLLILGSVLKKAV
jgi:hypothetical protein